VRVSALVRAVREASLQRWCEMRMEKPGEEHSMQRAEQVQRPKVGQG
jgi:hypothetical protein